LATVWAVLLGAAVGVGGSGIAAAKETQEYTLGEWSASSYTNDSDGQFTDCTAWATNQDSISLGVSVTKDYQLQFYLYDKTWNLPQNQSYPVSYWVDRGGQYRGKVVTSGKSTVYVDVDADNDVFQALKAGSEFTVRTSADDYVFDLSGSRAALGRLIDCVDQHSKSASSNPFGPGSGDDSGSNQPGGGQPSGGQQTSTQPGDNQPSGNQPSGNQPSGNQPSGGGSNSAPMNDFSASVDDVQKFLVDVTGAKPSMIKVSSKTDKSGALYYDFTTPLGGGQFWQEKPSNTQLQDMAANYVADYRKDCKGDFDDQPAKPVQSQQGALAAGMASCSNSPYQNNGPEVLSYSMAQQGDMISVYVTYTGGNAAKAKTDSLGHLIERRYEDMLQQN
jgi:hypothetical protein